MGGWDRFGEWITTLAVAAMTWASGVLGPPAAPDVANAAEPVPTSLQGWSIDLPSDLESPVIELQTDDVETLDEGTPPSDTSTAQTDASAPIESNDNDLELLDQGTPPPTQATTTAPVGATSEPAPVVSAPAPAVAAPMAAETPAAPVVTGPVLPPGFGSGRVQVAAGNNGFPVGLEACHVGAVTGRAYVGIDCGNDDSFVGHAASFTDFPFVVEAPFPFNDSESATTPATSTVDDSPGASDGDLFVLNNTGNSDFFVEDPRVPNVETTGSRGSVVSLAQDTHQQPRERIARQDSHKSRAKHNGSSANAQRADSSNDDVNTASKDHKQKHHKQDKDKDTSNHKNKNDNHKDSKDKKSKHKNQKKDKNQNQGNKD